MICLATPMDQPLSTVDLLLQARRQDKTAVAGLLEAYRGYLRLLARTSIDRSLRGKADPSDVAQEAIIHAAHHFLPLTRFNVPVTALFVAIATSAALVGLSSLAAPPAAPADPAIAFALDGDLAVMNADGQRQTVILSPEGRVNDISWSPDLDGDTTNGYQGSLVFEREFVENNATRFDLWVIDVQVTPDGVIGANLRNLAATHSVNPDWSPSGDLIAFDGTQTASDGTAQNGVFVVSPLGGVPTLVHADPADGLAGWPTWNPAGTHLAIASKSNGIYSLIIKDVANGTERVVIPAENGFTGMFELEWNRAGDRIAFHGEGTGLSKSIYIVQVDSGNFSAVPSTTSQTGFGPT